MSRTALGWGNLIWAILGASWGNWRAFVPRPKGRPRKLTIEQADMVRILAREGYSPWAIAQFSQAGVHDGTIRAIVKGVTYLAPRRDDEGQGRILLDSQECS